MRKSVQVKRSLFFAMFVLAMSAAMAAADDEVVRIHEFNASSLNSLELEYRAGTLTLEPSTSGNIEVELTIKQEQRRRWFSRTPDLTDMDLRSRTRGDFLQLEFNEDNVITDWVVRLPSLQELEINAGVGTIEGDLPGANTSIDLGVGSIELIALRSSTGKINLSVGVGETSVYGAGESSATQRALVSSESTAQGDGEHTVRVELGVGDVSLRLVGEIEN